MRHKSFLRYSVFPLLFLSIGGLTVQPWDAVVSAHEAQGSGGDRYILQYTGKSSWNAETKTVTIQSSGEMPNGKEEFFWTVSQDVDEIVLGAGVQFRGGFRVEYRPESKPLLIRGGDRKTSVIYGTNELQWTTAHGVPDNEKWKYGSISVLADAVVRVENLTAQNPRGYNISGYANKSVIHVQGCDLIDSRAGDNNNSDGFAGSAGSSIRDCLISTSDDGIKVYKDIVIEDVTIEQHRNGAPIQFGWGGEEEPATAAIRNLTIRGVDKQNLYNMAPFTWESGRKGSRTVSIQGIRLEIQGKLYSESDRSWRPIGLFELKPTGCDVMMTVVNIKGDQIDWGIIQSNLQLTVDGKKVIPR